MKVIVVGGTGRVGQATVKVLADRGYEVTAAGRSIDKITESETIKAVKFDLNEDVEVLSKIIEGHDAVVFTAGTAIDDLLKVHAFGVVKTAEAAKQAGVTRFLLVGAKWASHPELWSVPEIKWGIEQLHEYYIAKFFADNYLIHEGGLDYTIIEPDQLFEEPGTGRIELDNMSNVGTPIQDVAEVLVAALENDQTIGQIYTINKGETPIAEALNSKG